MKYLWLGGAWVPAEQARVAQAAHRIAIHRDFDAPLLCHADGRMHSSRSTYDAAVRAAGCEVIGKTEGKRIMREGLPRPLSMEPVSATLRRVLRETGE